MRQEPMLIANLLN